MRDPFAAKLLSVSSYLLAGLCPVCMGFYIPYYWVGIVAFAVGLGGLIVCRDLRRKGEPLPTAYLLLAVVGMLVGAFYASIIGPFILRFPSI